MEILLLAMAMPGWALTTFMIGAVLSDLSRPATNLRGRIVVAGALLLTFGPLIVVSVLKSISGQGEALLIISVTFGAAAWLMYAGLLIVDAGLRCVKRGRRRGVAA